MFSFITKFLGKTEEVLMIICLLLIGGLMCTEVFMRYFLDASVYGFEELAIYSMIVLIFVGAAYTTRTDTHIRIDLLNFFIKDKGIVDRIRWVVHFFNLFIVIVVAYWILQLFLKGPSLVTPELRLPLRIPQTITAICVVMMIYYYIYILITSFKSTWRIKK